MSTITITQQYGTHNVTACSGREIKYIVIHYTAGVKSTEGTALNLAKNWYTSSSCSCSSDFVVDDESIVQYNGDIENQYTWHCGGAKYSNQGGSLYNVCTNKNSIGIEICSTNSTGKITTPNDEYFYFTDKVVTVAVALVKFLMNKYGISADNVVRHYDSTGKLCPRHSWLERG